jgi:sialate O-acetylesterase
MRTLATSAALAAACFASASPALADVKLPAVISNNMVLQAGKPLPIWGAADAGEKVTVKAAGQEKSATADDKGKWRVALDPIDVSDPIELTVAGKNTITFKDVLIGEVWLCSGQSNMEFPLKRASNADEAIKAADHPKMRLFRVGRAYKDEPQEDLAGGKWELCSPQNVGEFTAVGYFFGAELHEKLNMPVGLIQSDWGGTRAEAWMPKATFDSLNLPYEPAWTQEWLHPKQNPASTQPAKERPYEAPAVLYNSMIAPFAGYAMRGAAWYQGETNTAYPVDYRRVLGAMITSWRDAWGEGEFPFLIVQLPNFEGPTRDWVALRKSQQQVTKDLPNVAMAVTIDLGEAKNIHPTRKQPVGHRLAVLAEKTVYGRDVPYSGPTFKSMQSSGGEITVSFDHADGGLVSKGEVQGFEIAGDDGKFFPAKAKITGDDQVVLSADGVASPKMVRYGWQNNPTCTLYNKADLPAAPFEAK